MLSFEEGMRIDMSFALCVPSAILWTGLIVKQDEVIENGDKHIKYN